MERRDFLLGLGATALLSSCQTLVPYQRPVGKGSLFLGMSHTRNVSVLRVLNLEDYTFEEMQIPLTLPHSIVRHKDNPDEIYIFEMLGSALKVNLRTKEYSLIDHLKSGHFFVGHALYSEKGILCLEHLPDSRVVVRMRSEKDLSLLGHDLAALTADHHIVRLPGTSIAVTSWSGPQNGKNFITFYDFEKQKVIHQLESPRRLIHMMPVSSSEIIGVTADIQTNSKPMSYGRHHTASENQKRLMKSVNYNGPSPMISASLNGIVKAHWPENQKDDLGWGFGVEKLPGTDQIFLTGHYHSGTVIVWKNYEVKGVIRTPAPEGIVATADGAEFVVLSDGRMKVYSSENLVLKKEISYGKNIDFIYRYG